MKMEVDDIVTRGKLEQVDKFLSIGDVAYRDCYAVFAASEVGDIWVSLPTFLRLSISEEDLIVKTPEELAAMIREELAYSCRYIADKILANGDYGKEVKIRGERLKRERAALR